MITPLYQPDGCDKLFEPPDTAVSSFHHSDRKATQPESLAANRTSLDQGISLSL